MDATAGRLRTTSPLLFPCNVFIDNQMTKPLAGLNGLLHKIEQETVSPGRGMAFLSKRHAFGRSARLQSEAPAPLCRISHYQRGLKRLSFFRFLKTEYFPYFLTMTKKQMIDGHKDMAGKKGPGEDTEKLVNFQKKKNIG